jgi:hypothetical protein
MEVFFFVIGGGYGCGGGHRTLLGLFPLSGLKYNILEILTLETVSVYIIK